MPTVIDSLARAAATVAETPPQRVLVAEGTYPQRYRSVTAVGYRQRADPNLAQQAGDFLAGRISGARPFQRWSLAAMVRRQREWSPSWVMAHNLLQLVPLVESPRHRPVLYAHNDLFRSYSRREAAKVLRRASLIVCVSEFLAERVRQQLPVALRQWVVAVPNGADCAQFTPARTAASSAASDPAEGLRVGFVGRMVPEKGADVLLRAAKLLDDPALEITVVGSTGFDERAELTAFERELREVALSLRSPVTFRPFTDRFGLPELLQAQDVLAVPSRWPEPWGLTVSEGQAAGLVVLASDIGGIPEAISDSSHLVPADDAEALAQQLRRFLDDPQLLAEHRRAARAHAEAHDWRASWQRLAGHLAGLE